MSLYERSTIGTSTKCLLLFREVSAKKCRGFQNVPCAILTVGRVENFITQHLALKKMSRSILSLNTLPQA